MLTDINQEILELKEKLRIMEKLESLRDMVKLELDKKITQKSILRHMMESEKMDVIKLEETSFSSIFLSITGRKEERLEKEKEEYITAKLKYDECIETIKELEQELNYAEDELSKYESVREDYETLLKKKERLLIEDGSERGQELNENLNRLNELKLDIKEVREAVIAGENANRALGEMKKHLNKAKNWGVWDMMGGGLISNIAKHSAIDEANTIAHNSQHLLKAFEKELADVNKFTNIGVNLSAFSTFADFFFDGFFVDWFVQSKIKDSLDSVEGTFYKIESILRDLRSNLGILQSEKNKIESNIKSILES